VGRVARSTERELRAHRAGFYTVVKATLVQILGLVVLLLGSAVLEWLIPIGSLAVLVGFVLYGTATLQARVLPRWCGVGRIVGLPVTIFLGEIWGFVVFGILWLALGVRALVEKERTASATLARKLNSVPTATVKDQAHSFVARLLRSRDFTRHVSAPEVRY
jgi:hypothetical protein